jgi:2-hydroxychromene-2-carboxylate isomerase
MKVEFHFDFGSPNAYLSHLVIPANQFFPVNTLQIMRGAVYAGREGFLEKYVDEVYRH